MPRRVDRDPRLVCLLCVLLLLPAAACQSDTDDDDTAASTEYTVEIEVELSEDMPTVATARCTTDAPVVVSAVVEFGTDSAFDRQVTASAGDDDVYQALVLGMKPARDYQLRCALVADGETLLSDAETITTGPAPASLPEFELAVIDPELVNDGYIVTSILSSPPAAIVIDRDGDFVWWYQEDEGFPPPMARVRLTRDDTSMVFQMPSNGADTWSDPDDVLRIALDGSEAQIFEVVAEHHDFVDLPDGNIAHIMFDYRELEGYPDPIVGDQIVEVQPDGTETTVWSVWDHAEFDPEQVDTTIDTGWSHSNALDYDPEEDVYYIGIRNFNAIWKVDRATGDLLWSLGGKEPTYEPEDPFIHQHQFHVEDGMITVFDNGLEENLESRAIRYSLNDETGVAEVEWEYIANPPVFCYGLGDVHHFADGNTLVTWSTAGQIDEVTADGELVWQLNSSLGGAFGYAIFRESF